MPAENVTVYLNAPKIRTVSAGEQTHITSVSFNPTANLTVGDTVKLSYATEAGWKVTGMALRKATDPATNPQDISSDFTKLSEGSYQFTMPDNDVCVDFKCEEKAVYVLTSFLLARKQSLCIPICALALFPNASPDGNASCVPTYLRL